MECFIASFKLIKHKKTGNVNTRIFYLRPTTRSSFIGNIYFFKPFFFNEFENTYNPNRVKQMNKWTALLGPGGGFLGVGTSELIVIGIVAWAVLGPKRLYQLAKDIGKISGEIKNVADEARQTFQQAVDTEGGEFLDQKFNENKEKNNLGTMDEKKKESLDIIFKKEMDNLEKKKSN
jgi:Sec-independent protein translocase protein TatA